MRFHSTKLSGVWLVEPERHVDERGFFARTWCMREFGEQGLETQFVQCNLSFNTSRGTLRGMHWQTVPHEEVKLVRCTRGAVYDVVVDVRPGSPTQWAWLAFELTEQNQRTVYIPPGIAHGFLTLVDNTELHYQMSQFYEPTAARGVRWNDPKLAIDWPFAVNVISPRDEVFPLVGASVEAGSCLA